MLVNIKLFLSAFWLFKQVQKLWIYSGVQSVSGRAVLKASVPSTRVYFLTPLIQLHFVAEVCTIKVRDQRQQEQGKEFYPFQFLCSINGSGNILQLCVHFVHFFPNFIWKWWNLLVTIYVIFFYLFPDISIKHDRQIYALVEKSALFPGVNQEHREACTPFTQQGLSVCFIFHTTVMNHSKICWPTFWQPSDGKPVN